MSGRDWKEGGAGQKGLSIINFLRTEHLEISPNKIFVEKPSKSNKTVVSELEFQASQVIGRLEEAVEKAEDGSSKGQVWKNSHGFLPIPSKSSDEILGLLEDLIAYEDSREDSSDEDVSPGGASLPQLDPIARLSIVTQSVAAYAGGLERSHLQRFSSRITSDTTRWLSHLFRFFDCAAFFHEDVLEGIVRLARMMLHYKYPKFLEDGYEALSARPPVIYSSVAAPLGVVQYICRQASALLLTTVLGLPMVCVRPVPCNTMFGSQQKMDVAALDRFIQEDKANNRVPLIVLADAGGGDLPKAETIRSVWIPEVNQSQEDNIKDNVKNQQVAILCDETTDRKGQCVFVILLKTLRADSKQSLFVGAVKVLQNASATECLRALVDTITKYEIPYENVVCVVTDGTTIAGHVDNLSRLQELCKSHDIWLHIRGHSLAALSMVSIPNVTLYRLFDTSTPRPPRSVGVARESTLPLVAGLTSDHFIRKMSCLPLWAALQSQQPGGESGTFTVNEVVTKPVSTAVLLESVACTVVFQFVPESSEGENVSRVSAYFDKLNSWLGQILQRDAPHVPVVICELESNGVVLRYCPLEMAGEKHPSPAEVDLFTSCLEQQLDILSATVAHKETFQRLVSASPRLRLVEMPGWAGLGGVRYVPEGWEQLMTDQAKEELNKLNMTLVEQLRSTDAAFSLGEGTDNLVCVRFGMVTAETDVEELLGLVVNVGKEVEESSKFIETMTEIVKKGIETATMDLQKENEERLWQEGILRHVPVFGSLVNWWSPPGKEGGIKGRSLNLTAGVVESTENIYRYHMQLQQGASSPPGSRSPPQPQVQTPVVPQHSRSSSHSSQGTPVVTTTTIS
uniref:Pyridoxal-dependent decarboxylase domain-containing protein 1 n=1 Tax=Timema monikensis TaxID=170555 RepID=A0A7R9E902_9NEOP|nr:unnamed protein product [Timema monikensis]